MIETEQTIRIDASIEAVWAYVREIQRWAKLVPGLRECIVLDANDSQWTVKVGVGGLVRTVGAQVHIDRWDGPGRVDFTYALQADPVTGSGAYLAAPKGPRETEVTLQLRVVGEGPMAPMWEALGRPLLPQLAQGFASQLKAEIEAASAPREAVARRPRSASASAGERLRSLWRAIFGSGGLHGPDKQERTR